MSRNSKAYDQEFKENVINYVLEHPEEKYTALGNKFGVHPITIAGWMKQYRSNDNQVIVRGSGNYASDEAKEIAKLKKELKDTKDALEVLKKAIGILGNKSPVKSTKRLINKRKKIKLFP